MKKNIKYIVIFLVVVLLIYILFSIYQKSIEAPVNYQTINLEKRNIVLKTVASGSIIPRKEIEIKPQAVSGILDKLFVEAGDLVKEGDVIAEIKVVPSISSLSSAENQLRVAKANLDEAKANYDRTKKLHEEKVVSDKTLLAAKTNYLSRKANYQNALNNSQIVKTGVAKSLQGEANTMIRSTISGMVVDVPIKEGVSVTERNNFNNGTTIATIADMSDLIFQGDVDEIDVGRLKVGADVRVLIGALPKEVFQATLEYISPKGKSRSNEIVFEIKAALVEKDSFFVRDGYSANGEIVLEEKKDVWSLNETFIHFRNDSAFVWVLKTEEPQEFEEKYVTLGLSDDIFVEILSGLEPDDPIRGYVEGSRVAINSARERRRQ